MGAQSTKVQTFDIESQVEVNDKVDIKQMISDLTQIKINNRTFRVNLRDKLFELEDTEQSFPKITEEQSKWMNIGYTKAIKDIHRWIV